MRTWTLFIERTKPETVYDIKFGPTADCIQVEVIDKSAYAENRKLQARVQELEAQNEKLKEALSMCVEIIDDPGAHDSVSRASALYVARATLNDGESK